MSNVVNQLEVCIDVGTTIVKRYWIEMMESWIRIYEWSEWKKSRLEMKVSHVRSVKILPIWKEERRWTKTLRLSLDWTKRQNTSILLKKWIEKVMSLMLQSSILLKYFDQSNKTTFIYFSYQMARSFNRHQVHSNTARENRDQAKLEKIWRSKITNLIDDLS